MALLTDAQKTDVRRFCGYGAIGYVAAQQGGYRFFREEGFLEFRLLHLQDTESAVLTTMLARLNQLEASLYGVGVGSNLNVSSAASFVRNPNETADRRQLYTLARRELCAFLEMPPGPALRSGIRIIA